MREGKRQALSDNLGLTRVEAAKRLGRHVSWVRRREGKELHPTVVNGIHRFAPTEVEALTAQLEAKRKALSASEAVTTEIHQMFDLFLQAPRSWSVEGIAERAGVEPRVVSSMFKQWADEFLNDVPRLLSRKELHAIEEREEREAEREHEARMAEWAREEEERSKRWADERKRREREEAAADAARARERARRRAAQEASVTAAMSRRTEPDFQDQLSRLARAKTLQEMLGVLLEMYVRSE